MCHGSASDTGFENGKPPVKELGSHSAIGIYDYLLILCDRGQNFNFSNSFIFLTCRMGGNSEQELVA